MSDSSPSEELDLSGLSSCLSPFPNSSFVRRQRSVTPRLLLGVQLPSDMSQLQDIQNAWDINSNDLVNGLKNTKLKIGTRSYNKFYLKYKSVMSGKETGQVMQAKVNGMWNQWKRLIVE